MNPSKPVITTYRFAWIEFKKTQDYKGMSSEMKRKGILQPYRDNMIMNAFAAGWNATGKKIKFKRF